MTLRKYEIKVIEAQNLVTSKNLGISNLGFFLILTVSNTKTRTEKQYKSELADRSSNPRFNHSFIMYVCICAHRNI